MQPVDYTTLIAVCQELQQQWLPARLEQVHQRDRHTIFLRLRTINGVGWLCLSWHPQAARVCIGNPPPRNADTFTFSDQLRHQLHRLALVSIHPIAPWERVLDLQFTTRPGEEILWHLYAEVMGKRSNAILVNQENIIVTAAHQVSEAESSVRPVETGEPYEPPPPMNHPTPSLQESFERWQERVSLIPGQLSKQLLKSYRGLSPSLAHTMIRAAELDPKQNTTEVSAAGLQALFAKWQEWLQRLQKGDFFPQWIPSGYSVMPWEEGEAAASTQELLDRYYSYEENQHEFKQLRHQLQQKLNNLLKKQQKKYDNFQERLQQAEEAQNYKQQGDLLMANLYQMEPGMEQITLADFETGNPVTISLDPEKNGVSNAQAKYKKHQKLKRARQAVAPLLAQVEQEKRYLEQVENALAQLPEYRQPEDLQTLAEIRDELVQQGYMQAPEYRPQRKSDGESESFDRFRSPGGFEVLVGRNNRQNDILSFRTATEYDLWFHAQEIAGSHVLLRLPPGSVATEADLQFAADVAARFSRGKTSDRVPVVYTKPKYVYKPKGAQPGMVIYKNETVIWGSPGRLSA
ncbi:NFACT RNA binding domain-containing protein [Geitlerinema sp. PCC 9228]|uniref:Rqc2 family fibronectin-binding protein n=1 Tax=Geitlerinema sp. PCC 9228 TaxID=111611 RepID=UPI0008F9DD57|nr:NFACT RNA binding domain-containing protein [Geitlerinema sp. PCC 9228]